ncbi:MAG: serine/threonine-protein kinase [Desulfatiglandaceae bacterium]|jgi:eukaryotic-like serine/threonine-protein kinase
MEQLGRYLIQEEIGKGGMGIVYRAYDPEIDRNLALKVLRSDQAEDEEIVRRFVREAKAAGRLTHPNIVIIYDVGEDKGRAFIAMELLSGLSLENMIRKGPLPLKDAFFLAGQIAHALHYAHRKGVIHRDIKPSNIIIDGVGQVKITDFGIARVQDVALQEQTRTGEILGTPTYMSPEQIQGKKVGGSADLFSLGLILYEMISGEKPFKGDSIVSLFHAILNEQPIPLKRKISGLSGDVDKIVLKALEKDPSKRYDSGDDFARALLEFQERGETVVLSGAPGRTAGKKHKKSIWGIGSLFLGILALLILGTVFLVVPRFLHQREVPVEKPKTMAPAAMKPSSETIEESMKGTVMVTSDPAGASVFINGRPGGTTPVSIALDQGAYEIKLEMVGYLTWEAQVQVAKTQTIPLEVELTPKAE